MRGLFMIYEILLTVLLFVFLTLYSLEIKRRKQLEKDRLDRLNNYLTESDLEVRQAKSQEFKEAKKEGILKREKSHE